MQLSPCYQSGVIQTGARGRPRFDINADQLEYLESLSFSWIDIASMFGVSRMTIYRRGLEYGMIQDIEDEELMVLLQEMRAEFHEMREVMVRGQLRALGYKVTRERLRTIIRATDPTALRATTGPIARRLYNVPGPNSLWYIGMLSILY